MAEYYIEDYKPYLVDYRLLNWCGFSEFDDQNNYPEYTQILQGFGGYLEKNGLIKNGKMPVAIVRDEVNPQYANTFMPEKYFSAAISYLYEKGVFTEEKPTVFPDLYDDPNLQAVFDKEFLADPKDVMAVMWVQYVPKDHDLNGAGCSVYRIRNIHKGNHVRLETGSNNWGRQRYAKLYDDDHHYYDPLKIDYYDDHNEPNAWKEVYGWGEDSYHDDRDYGYVVHFSHNGRPWCKLETAPAPMIPFSDDTPADIAIPGISRSVEIEGEKYWYCTCSNPDEIGRFPYGEQYSVQWFEKNGHGCIYWNPPPNPTPLVFYPQKHEGRYPFSCIAVPFSGVHPLGITGATPGQLVAIGQDGGFVAKDIPKGKKVLE